MIDPHCEQVLISLMVRRDGEVAPLAAEEVDAHLAACASCRTEAAADAALGEQLAAAAATRPAAPALWDALCPRLRPVPAGRILVAAAALVIALRAGFLVRYPSALWMGSLVGVAVIIVGFLVLRENPFRIDANPSRVSR
jgi:hypothetical protein